MHKAKFASATRRGQASKGQSLKRASSTQSQVQKEFLGSSHQLESRSCLSKHVRCHVATDIPAAVERPGHTIRSLQRGLMGTDSDSEDLQDYPTLPPPSSRPHLPTHACSRSSSPSSRHCLNPTHASPTHSLLTHQLAQQLNKAISMPPPSNSSLPSSHVSSPCAPPTHVPGSPGRYLSLQHSLFVPSDQVALHGSPSGSPRTSLSGFQKPCGPAGTLTSPSECAALSGYDSDSEALGQQEMAQQQFKEGVKACLKQTSSSHVPSGLRVSPLSPSAHPLLSSDFSHSSSPTGRPPKPPVNHAQSAQNSDSTSPLPKLLTQASVGSTGKTKGKGVVMDSTHSSQGTRLQRLTSQLLALSRSSTAPPFIHPADSPQWRDSSNSTDGKAGGIGKRDGGLGRGQEGRRGEEVRQGSVVGAFDEALEKMGESLLSLSFDASSAAALLKTPPPSLTRNTQASTPSQPTPFSSPTQPDEGGKESSTVAVGDSTPLPNRPLPSSLLSQFRATLGSAVGGAREKLLLQRRTSGVTQLAGSVNQAAENVTQGLTFALQQLGREGERLLVRRRRRSGWRTDGNTGTGEEGQLAAQVAALTAKNQELTAKCDQLTGQVQSAEARAGALQGGLERAKAQRTIETAVQVFRGHVAGLPAGVDTGLFYEDEEAVVGKGGCGKVYAWRAGGRDWAVKSDSVSYRYSYTGQFEPERCGDLLPAFLPPHPNVLAPAAWWVGSASPSQLPPSPSPPASPVRGGGSLRHGPLPSPMEGAESGLLKNLPGKAASVPASAPGPPPPAKGFRLFTMWPRLTCSLREHLDVLAAEAADTPGSAEKMLMDSESVMVVIRDVAAGLAHLQASGVCHCDIKPENIMLQLEGAEPGEAGFGKEGLEEGGGGRKQLKVAQAVLIDFGLARLMTEKIQKLDARGGTWLYKAPEQLPGPCALMGLMEAEKAGEGGDEMSEAGAEGEAEGGVESLGCEEAHIVRQTDTWALGALICFMANNGTLPSRRGLPLGQKANNVAKWGDRPTSDGGVEPFFMTYEDILPRGERKAEERKAEERKTGEEEEVEGVVVGDEKLAKELKGLAVGCMRKVPGRRLDLGAVKARAEKWLKDSAAAAAAAVSAAPAPMV